MESGGNTILVTGGGSGIGRALARSFHQAGNKVIIAGRRRETLEEAAAANPGVIALPLDLRDGAVVKSFASKLMRRMRS